jgi:hypothetical protein
MKKSYIDYYFDDEDLNQDEIRESIIGEFIESGSPKSSKWWKSMAATVTKIKDVHDWVADKQKKYLKDSNFGVQCVIPDSIRTMKTCPGVTQTLYDSYLIKSPVDVTVTFTKETAWVFNTPETQKQLIKFSTVSELQYHTKENNLFKNRTGIKIELPIKIRTNGVPYVFLQPSWHSDMWFEVAPGAISESYTQSQPLNIQGFIKTPTGTEPVSYKIKAGDVLAYIWFPKKMTLRYTPIRHHLKHFARKWSTKSRHLFKR